jgi:phospholipid transport system substrate-binding protein
MQKLVTPSLAKLLLTGADQNDNKDVTNMNIRCLPADPKPKTPRRQAILFIASVWAVLASANGAAIAGPATDLVEKFHDDLIAVMKKADTISIEKRYEILEPSVRRTFNMPVMIRIVSGAAWRSAGEEDKGAVADAFTKMSVTTYASRFDGYSGQRFETLAETTGSNNSVVVRTRIVSPGDTPVKLTYILRKYSGKWRAIDVILAGGISELALRHSEYRSTLKKGGLSGLANILNKKSDEILGRN